MRRRKWLWVVLIVAGVALSAVALVNLLVQRAAASAFGPELTSLCRDYQPASSLPGIEATSRLVVLQGNGKRIHRFHDDLPDGRRAGTAGEVDEVVCIRPYSTTVEKCRYTMGGRVKRVRRGYEVLVVDPALGTPVAFERILGPNPARCPESKGFNLFGETIKGDYPRFTYAVFSSLLASFSSGD